MTKEAKTKPQAWTGPVTLLERLAIYQALEGGNPACGKCGAGKLTFSEPRRIDKYNRLFDRLKLDDIERVEGDTAAALNAQLAKEIGAIAVSDDDEEKELASDVAPLTVELPNDLLHFLVGDILAQRSRFSFRTGVMVFVTLLQRLFAYAKEANIRYGGERDKSSDEEVSDQDVHRSLGLSGDDRAALLDLLRRPATCDNKFPSNVGGILSCGRPADGPSRVVDLQIWCRLVGQVEATADGICTLDLGTKRLLSALISGRAHMLERGPRRLRKIAADLEAMAAEDPKPAPAE